MMYNDFIKRNIIISTLVNMVAVKQLLHWYKNKKISQKLGPTWYYCIICAMSLPV